MRPVTALSPISRVNRFPKIERRLPLQIENVKRQFEQETRPSDRRWPSRSEMEPHGRMGEFFRSSGGFWSRPSDHPPHPVSGNKGRLCRHARQTSEIVPARPPMTKQASPAKAISRLRASPMPHGMTTVAGQSGSGISPGVMMLTTSPPAFTALCAATRVAGLPQPLTTVIPKRARSSPT
jgi:hypothetical protein